MSDARVVRHNRAACELFGPQLRRGVDLSALFDVASREKLRSILARGPQPLRTELQVQDDGPAPVPVRFLVFPNAQGRSSSSPGSASLTASDPRATSSGPTPSSST